MINTIFEIEIDWVFTLIQIAQHGLKAYQFKKNNSTNSFIVYSYHFASKLHVICATQLLN